MNAKKILALLLGAMMLLSLAACGAKDNDKQADMSGDGSAMTGEPKTAEEALALHKELLERENALLSENAELWEKVFMAADKGMTMQEDGKNEYFVSVRHPRPQEVRHPHRENPTPIPHRWCMAAARIAHGRHAVGSFRNCVQPSHGLAFNGQYMRVVNDTVADGIGHGRIIKQLMPAGDVELRTEDSGCHLTPGFN